MTIRSIAFALLRISLLPFLFREIQRRKVAIVVYHAPRPEVFDRHLTILKRVYNIVSLAEYVAAREAGTTSALPRKALQWTKTVTNLPLKALFQAHFDAGVGYESMSNLTADHREAVAAFREKRKPLFAGR